MAYEVSFCQGCPFAGKVCSGEQLATNPAEAKNEAWTGTLLPQGRSARAEGVAVWWEDKDGNKTAEVHLLCAPENGNDFSPGEFALACLIAATMVDGCKREESLRRQEGRKFEQRTLFWRIPLCGAFNTSEHELARFPRAVLALPEEIKTEEP
jgi:hypothetical protein